MAQPPVQSWGESVPQVVAEGSGFRQRGGFIEAAVNTHRTSQRW